jgi:hypothetical protein
MNGFAIPMTTQIARYDENQVMIYSRTDVYSEATINPPKNERGGGTIGECGLVSMPFNTSGCEGCILSHCAVGGPYQTDLEWKCMGECEIGTRCKRDQNEIDVPNPPSVTCTDCIDTCSLFGGYCVEDPTTCQLAPTITPQKPCSCLSILVSP